MPISDKELSRRQEVADYLLARYPFGPSLRCLEAGRWDISVPDDLTQVLTLEQVGQTDETLQVSFHVRFAADGGVGEAYALDMASGNEIGPARSLFLFPTSRERFGGTWGEHPDWPVSDWQSEVASDDTRLGYWEWVEARLEEAAEA